MAILYIGSRQDNMSAIPDPAVLSIGLQDVDASTTRRSANGTMLRDRICGGSTAKRKLNLEWNYIDNAKAGTILQAIAGVFFYVQYPDPYTGTTRTAEFYAGDRTLPMYNAVVNNGNVLWEKLQVNLIEK